MRWHTFILFIMINTAFAGTFDNMWQRPDEKGAALLSKGKALAAAKQFENREWKGVALYRGGHYLEAAKILKTVASSRAQYNRGNALAHLGQYQKAIAAYNQALEKDPNNADAKFNRDLLKRLLKKNQSKKQKQQARNGGQTKPSSSKSTKQDNEQKQSAKEKNSHGNRNQQADESRRPKPQRKTPLNTKQQANNKQAPLQQRSKTLSEKEQANKLWLKQIPDNPGGLLRRKFWRDYMNRYTRSI